MDRIHMKPSRREFMGMMAASPILLGMQDKAGTKAPVLGAGQHRFEAIHDWGTLPPQIKWGNTHGVVEDSQGNIYVHHTVHATSDSADTVVVFDANGKFVRSWGKEYRGVAHGFKIRKEGSSEFLYLTVNAANPKMTPQPEAQAVVLKTTLAGEIVWKIDRPPDVEGYRPGPDGARKPYNPTNVAIAPNGDVYVGDGYGSYLHQSVQRQGRVHPLVRGARRRAGQARRAAWRVGRYANREAGACRRRPSQQPAAALHARRQPHRLRAGVQAAVRLRRAAGAGRHPRPPGPRHA